MATLVLNADYRPINIISWQEAVCLYLTQEAMVIKEGTQIVRSQFLTVTVPEVMVLKTYKKVKAKATRASRSMIFYRDDFTCQYCGVQHRKATHKLNIDHVHPKSKGGPRTPNNLVTACIECNTAKGSKSLKEAGMKLLHPVREVHNYSRVNYQIKRHYPQWEEYI